MQLQTLIGAEELRPHLASVRLLDCSHELSDPTAGPRAWREGHLPGAVHAHVDDDLSGAKIDAHGRFRGRHPLPGRADFAATVGRLGIGRDTLVVAYDGQGGPYAARAWWLLRWLGHEAVAVLDGGTATWRAAGGALSTDVPAIAPLPPYPASATPAMPVIEAEALLAGLGRVRLLDARGPERFRGEVEPLDACAGHVPGALNRCFKDNLRPDGRFKPAQALREEWQPLLAGAPQPVQMCGSGVTACHNLLAMAHAGLGDSILYPGSWSEWSSDPLRPVARS